MKAAVIRFSALGDVAMTVPVVWSAAMRNPQVQFTVVTQPWLCALYEGLAPNVTTHPCQPHGKHKGIRGMWRLARELKAEGIDTVIDIHDVLRTKLLRRILKMMGCHVQSIDKGRAEKRQLVRKGWTKCAPLRQQTERYADVFRTLGLDCALDFTGLPTLPPLAALPSKADGERWIGVAPTAAHASKTYPENRLNEALRLVMEKGNKRLFFFGTEDSVKQCAARLAADFPDRIHHASAFAHGLREELSLMQRLDTMLSMDSGNMHLASLVGLRTVSIWGATHPAMGFLGHGQQLSDCLQSSRACRPCTAYGAKPRCQAPYPCLTDITPAEVAALILQTAKKELSVGE